MINVLGDFNDQEIITGCRQRFQKFLAEPASLAPDLRPAVFNVVSHHADEATWMKLHELGRKTTSMEEKQNYYDALTRATDPKLAKRALQIALTGELPTSRALYMVSSVARYSEHPDIAWQFAKAHMKELLAKADALGVNRYAPSLFLFFSDPIRIEELRAYAKGNLPPGSAKAVAQAIDEIEFRSEFKQRLLQQLTAWIKKKDSISAAPSPAASTDSAPDR